MELNLLPDARVCQCACILVRLGETEILVLFSPAFQSLVATRAAQLSRPAACERRDLQNCLCNLCSLKVVIKGATKMFNIRAFFFVKGTTTSSLTKSRHCGFVYFDFKSEALW